MKYIVFRKENNQWHKTRFVGSKKFCYDMGVELLYRGIAVLIKPLNTN